MNEHGWEEASCMNCGNDFDLMRCVKCGYLYCQDCSEDPAIDGGCEVDG